MNRSYRTKQHRALSQEAEDASSEGMTMTSNSMTGRESLMTSVVRAASAFNNILLENCGLCTVYCDKQVQYEDYVQHQYDVGTGAMGHLYSQLNATAATASITPSNVIAAGNGDHNKNAAGDSDFINPTNGMDTPPNTNLGSPSMSTNNERIEVQRYYREFLFDEESVVRSVGSRGAADDEG
jgi:hypothetical protein